MSRLDRLSALMARFELSVAPCPPDQANFCIHGSDTTPTCLSMTAKPCLTPAALAHAHVSWGGADNPLLTALPSEIRHDLTDDPDMQAIARLFISEMQAARCGVASVLNRLGEVLIVRLMRAQIEQGGVRMGLLAALSDPRLSRAVVAIHDRPGHPWRLDELAGEAGLSTSRFAHLFRTRVGQTPLSYLRHWRLVLAKQDIERGDRIARVAARYAYGSPEALSRAFSGHFGHAPRTIRAQIAEARPD
ncbi:MAG: AraC family transcriptional regulator [Pseudomonadota bacterium]